MNQAKLVRVGRTVLLTVLSLMIVVPLVILFVSSLKGTRQEILADAGSFKAFLVPNPTLQNFADILGPKAMTPFLQYMLNSGIVLLGTVALTLLISTMAAFVLLRGQFKGRKLLLGIITALYIIPGETIMLPMLYECLSLGITDSYWVQMLPFVASPLFIFLFYQFFSQVPTSIGEAALIDGAGQWRIFQTIYLPLNGPALATVAILQGMGMWSHWFN